jgi:hypothetical protein
MINTASVEINKLILHKIGNKFNEEKNMLSDAIIELNGDDHEVMKLFFLKPFEGLNEFFRFRHHTEIDLNPLYRYSKSLLSNNVNF